MATKRARFCGWGYEGEGPSQEEENTILARYAERFEVAGFERLQHPTPEQVTLAAPRVDIPAALSGICTTDHWERLQHTYGKSYPDYVRMYDLDFRHAPDAVAYPENEEDIAALFDWAAGAKVAVVPFGGGSSVVGGVEPVIGGGFNGAISVDLARLDRVLEVDKTSRAALIQGGMRTPEIEAALKPEGLTLRHFPQSFDMATLGGMIATRSGGHYATLYTHIDDFVENVRMVTPQGVMESRRLPGSGAGPSPDRLMIGSEGALGIITQAWMRLQDRPTHRASTAVMFESFLQGAEAVRALTQSGLFPTNVRLLDQNEAYLNGFGDGQQSVVVLAFESADHDVGTKMARGLEICRELGGKYDADAAKDPDGHKAGAAGAWRNAFIRMPYYREALISAAVISDTFETSITWDRFESFHENVMAATQAAIEDATGRPGIVTCRFTHAYPDGAAPYYTYQALGRHGALMEQWQQIKNGASDAVHDHGGTITHHHAVGRDHMPWYEKQVPSLFSEALAGVKDKLDPAGILNPGILLKAD